jgi:hypothetical protein
VETVVEDWVVLLAPATDAVRVAFTVAVAVGGTHCWPPTDSFTLVALVMVWLTRVPAGPTERAPRSPAPPRALTRRRGILRLEGRGTTRPRLSSASPQTHGNCCRTLRCVVPARAIFRSRLTAIDRYRPLGRRATDVEAVIEGLHLLCAARGRRSFDPSFRHRLRGPWRARLSYRRRASMGVR